MDRPKGLSRQAYAPLPEGKAHEPYIAASESPEWWGWPAPTGG